MDVHASLRNLRIAPRKVRLVVDTVRGLNAQTAETRLTFLQKGAAEPVLKLLRSAMANAEHNFHLAKDSLYVKHIVADAGATIKRFRPRAFGRAATIRKRMTHVTIILAPKADKAAAQAKAPTASVESAPAPAPAKRATAKKPAASKKPAIKSSPDA
ncbi:50S ribosomal protein L22 [Patescibacteria group bacterium]|nr:50S ribosomal protein L22 [Patescibacteria group bacterium]MDQ5919663.1 large subunit ribosomal protein [Patescibacteria group bacterium]